MYYLIFSPRRGFKISEKSNLGNSKLFFFLYRKSLIATVEKQLLGEHLTAILQKGNWQFINQAAANNWNKFKDWTFKSLTACDGCTCKDGYNPFFPIHHNKLSRGVPFLNLRYRSWDERDPPILVKKQWEFGNSWFNL